MVVLVVAEAIGVTAEQDAAVVKRLDLEGSPPCRDQSRGRRVLGCLTPP
jgi:hypothetical protein